MTRSTFAAGLLGLVLISACSAGEQIIGLQENIHHDDFEYSAQSVVKTERIGTLRAHGTFVIVAFQVENQARRVDHKWDNTIASITDEHGARYEDDAAAQKELNRVEPFDYKDKYVTPAGVTETTMLVFDLPKDVREPLLQVRGSLLMGDVFDRNQYKK